LDNEEALQEIKHQLSEIKISAAKKSPITQDTIVGAATNDLNNLNNSLKSCSMASKNSIHLSNGR
jgi:hypothetical protein